MRYACVCLALIIICFPLMAEEPAEKEAREDTLRIFKEGLLQGTHVPQYGRSTMDVRGNNRHHYVFRQLRKAAAKRKEKYGKESPTPYVELDYKILLYWARYNMVPPIPDPGHNSYKYLSNVIDDLRSNKKGIAYYLTFTLKGVLPAYQFLVSIQTYVRDVESVKIKLSRIALGTQVQYKLNIAEMPLELLEIRIRYYKKLRRRGAFDIYVDSMDLVNAEIAKRKGLEAPAKLWRKKIIKTSTVINDPRRPRHPTPEEKPYDITKAPILTKNPVPTPVIKHAPVIINDSKPSVSYQAPKKKISKFPELIVLLTKLSEKKLDERQIIPLFDSIAKTNNRTYDMLRFCEFISHTINLTDIERHNIGALKAEVARNIGKHWKGFWISVKSKEGKAALYNFMKQEKSRARILEDF